MWESLCAFFAWKAVRYWNISIYLKHFLITQSNTKLSHLYPLKSRHLYILTYLIATSMHFKLNIQLIGHDLLMGILNVNFSYSKAFDLNGDHDTEGFPKLSYPATAAIYTKVTKVISSILPCFPTHGVNSSWEKKKKAFRGCCFFKKTKNIGLELESKWVPWKFWGKKFWLLVLHY